MIAPVSPLLLYLASLVIRVVSAITQPRVARCPDGFALLLGVPPSGVTECVSTFDPRPTEREGHGANSSMHSSWDAGRLPMRVWCESGEVAVVVDARTVGCRKGPQS